ncbi:MAG: hypothetical protein ACYTAO_21940 [Planctomycetota bacterium]|jgi:hypothetical protein
MAGFDEGYAKCCRGRRGSEELRLLLARVYDMIHTVPADPLGLKVALVALMSFLCEPQHRNDETCWLVDTFFSVEDHWSRRWEGLPQDYRQLLDDIGGALHDTVRAPTTAHNFGSTPEQLLHRAKRLEVDSSGGSTGSEQE